LGFEIEKTLPLSHFRVGFLKRLIPTSVLVFLDSLFQWTGALWQLSPSVFMRAKVPDGKQQQAIPSHVLLFFKCSDCGHSPLTEKKDYLECSNCRKKWGVKDGIYDFREPIEQE
jgi:DNA-directed RNA polymerase subunit RPC12/RpoP